jgi:hypothetical protein
MNSKPKLNTTEIGPEPWEWIPQDFPSFVEELKLICKHCSVLKHLIIFRGHRDRDWLLDSTFARYCKERIFGIGITSKLRRDYRLSIDLQRLLGNLLLYKFGEQSQPHQDLFALAEKHSIDPWFEWMKRIQQYPEEDLGTLRGSFILDWSQAMNVGVYFANENRRKNDDGAIWICDIDAIGAIVHQEMTVGAILEMFHASIKNDESTGLPLVFHPKEQIACQRARNQDVIYVAQMDLRIDLADTWLNFERVKDLSEKTFLKVVLPKGTTGECDQWLEHEGITKDYIYPDLPRCEQQNLT